MQIGYATTFQNPGSRRSDKEVWDDELHITDLAIELGFDTIWSTEHHFTSYEMIPNPLQFLAWVIGRSPTIRIGTMVVVLPWHDPLRVAEEIAVLENLSNGRMILGIGRGVCQMEFDGQRVPMEESRGRFNEAAGIVLSALETGVVESSPDGFFKIPRRDLRPAPIYSFKGRTFGAAGSIASMPILANLGIGLLTVPSKPWGELEKELNAYRSAWAEARPDEPRPLSLLDQFLFVHEDEETAKELAYNYIGGYFSEASKHYDFSSPKLANTKGYEGYKDFSASMAADPQKMANIFIENQAWGTPDEVIEKVRDHGKRTESGSLLSHFLFGGMPRDVCEASIRLFTEKVQPVVRQFVRDPFAEVTPLKPDRSRVTRV